MHDDDVFPVIEGGSSEYAAIVANQLVCRRGRVRDEHEISICLLESEYGQEHVQSRLVGANTETNPRLIETTFLPVEGG